MNKNKWFLNGGRGSGQTYRRLFEYYENKVAELEKENAEFKEKLANADYQLEGRDLEIKELKAQIEKMKCCCNCKHSRTEYEHCETDELEKWEIKEK